MKRLKQYIPVAIPVAFVLVSMLFSHSCANTTQAPTGGLKDTIPPVVVGTFPMRGASNVPLKGQEFVITFNEFVSIKTPANIFLSPPTSKKPKSKVKGKSIVVSLEDDDELAPDQTYTIEFTDALADNNEGNMFPGYTYVFSTGERIDSMMLSGIVMDCSTLQPVKGARVMAYKTPMDSAVFLLPPDAMTKTDDWGYFALRNIQDTLYRLYAVLDDNNDSRYDPATEQIAFVDSMIRPVKVAYDTLPELTKYDMKDTLKCLARETEYEMLMFREKNAKQYLKNFGRLNDRSCFISFMAPRAHIDTLWIGGMNSENIISQMNQNRDSLELWINDRRMIPDTLHLFVNYRKTDTLGALVPVTEEHKLVNPQPRQGVNRFKKREIKQEDTLCVLKLTAKPETFEQYGYQLEFVNPIINGAFDSLIFTSTNPREQVQPESYTWEMDSLNLRKFILRPSCEIQTGYKYKMKIPANIFRDINGSYNDSTEVEVGLPTDEKLSTLVLELESVTNKYIVEMLTETGTDPLRTYIIDTDTTLTFPYIQEGKYRIRITEDKNRNSLVDTGDLLTHLQPEQVIFYKMDGKDPVIEIMPSVELSQRLNLLRLFGYDRSEPEPEPELQAEAEETAEEPETNTAEE